MPVDFGEDFEPTASRPERPVANEPNDTASRAYAEQADVPVLTSEDASGGTLTADFEGFTTDQSGMQESTNQESQGYRGEAGLQRREWHFGDPSTSLQTGLDINETSIVPDGVDISQEEHQEDDDNDSIDSDRTLDLSDSPLWRCHVCGVLYGGPQPSSSEENRPSTPRHACSLNPVGLISDDGSVIEVPDVPGITAAMQTMTLRRMRDGITAANDIDERGVVEHESPHREALSEVQLEGTGIHPAGALSEVMTGEEGSLQASQTSQLDADAEFAARLQAEEWGGV